MSYRNKNDILSLTSTKSIQNYFNYNILFKIGIIISRIFNYIKCFRKQDGIFIFECILIIDEGMHSFQIINRERYIIKLKDKMMNEEFEVYGRFKYENQNYEGVLSNDGSLYKLKFNSTEIEPFNKNKTIKSIEFYTTNGEYLIIQNGVNYKERFNFPGFYEFEYVFNEFWLSIDGATLPEHFIKAQVNFSGLKEYMRYSPYTIETNAENSYYKINFNKKAVRTISCAKDMILKINCHCNINTSDNFEMRFKYKNYLNIEYYNLKPSGKCISDSLDLRNLFSLITNEKHKLYEVILVSFEEESEKSNRFKIFRRLPFEFKEYHKMSQRYEISNFLNKNLEKIFVYFNENKDLFEDIFSSYIKLLYTDRFVSSYLAELLKMNEGLHLRITGTQKNLVKRYKEIFYSLDNDLKVHLKGLVNFKTDIFYYLKDYRNYYSHYFPVKRKPTYKWDNDLRIGEFVLQLHKSYLLTQIGIPSKDIVKILKVTHVQFE
ncbi:hypothetical protein BU019_12385 [Staphylococcus simulans]|nr:hypothetical protein BU054_05490 [Staphylococcus simulans]PTJ49693.1 hypothetical protein BU019_12385 [Staphylococcus simulans]RIN55667.1 hypothetical protein BU029_02505 [Staphylococcus simulans]